MTLQHLGMSSSDGGVSGGEAAPGTSPAPPSACLIAGATDGIGLDFCIAAAMHGPSFWLPVDRARLSARELAVNIIMTFIVIV